MAIQVWDGTKYIGAELGRFGPTGTLKEALVWDSATSQYVTVWQNTPVVHITGTVEGESSEQLGQALDAYGLERGTVTTLPFLLDTSQATELKSMLFRCSSLTTVPDMDTSNVTNMDGMFAGCSALASVPDMDTSQVTNMDNMFSACDVLTSVPDLETSQVTSMRYTFAGCSALASVPDLETSQVTDMDGMFYYCSSLTDGNVRCIGKNPSVVTTSMIEESGLTREPFYDTNGNPI